MDKLERLMALQVHCRVGSSEIDHWRNVYDYLVHCRVGSSEIVSAGLDPHLYGGQKPFPEYLY